MATALPSRGCTIGGSAWLPQVSTVGWQVPGSPPLGANSFVFSPHTPRKCTFISHQPLIHLGELSDPLLRAGFGFGGEETIFGRRDRRKELPQNQLPGGFSWFQLPLDVFPGTQLCPRTHGLCQGEVTAQGSSGPSHSSALAEKKGTEPERS